MSIMTWNFVKLFIFSVFFGISLAKDFVTLYQVKGEDREEICTLRFPSEKHVCQSPISYELTSGHYCNFKPTYQNQTGLLDFAHTHGGQYEALKELWEMFLRSYIGRSVATYILGREFGVPDLRTMKERLHLMWFYAKSYLYGDIRTPFDKTFFGKLPVNKTIRHRKGPRSWAGYTFVHGRQHEFEVKDISTHISRRSGCGKSELHFISYTYTADKCDNRVHGDMVIGTSLYFDLAVFTIAAEVLRRQQLEEVILETTLQDSPQCPVRVRAKSIRYLLDNHLDHVEYVKN